MDKCEHDFITEGDLWEGPGVKAEHLAQQRRPSWELRHIDGSDCDLSNHYKQLGQINRGTRPDRYLRERIYLVADLMNSEIEQPQDLDKCRFLRQKFMTNVGLKGKALWSPVIDCAIIVHRNTEPIFGGKT
jgi:hypothetical protein